MRRLAQRWMRFLPLLQRLGLAAVLLAAAQAALLHPLSHLAPAHDIAFERPDAAALPQAYQAGDYDQDAPRHAPGCDTCAALHALAFLADAAQAGPDHARLAEAPAVRLTATPRTAERRAPYASRAPPLA